MKKRTCIIGYSKAIQRMEQRAMDYTLAGGNADAALLRERIRSLLAHARDLHEWKNRWAHFRRRYFFA